MLLAAARRVGKELAKLRTGEDEPAPERIRESIRDVISHCIYGVDRNPLAVDLCRVALWLESHTAGKPLTFLDHRIRCGDSLVGVFDLGVLKQCIPDKAFDPCEGDDKPTARAAAKKNREERSGAQDLFALRDSGEAEALTRHSRDVDAIPDDSPELIRRKKELFEASHRDPAWQRQKQACDLWTAAFFQTLTADSVAITSAALADHLGGRPIDARLHGNATMLALRQPFFHWPLEFPEVFAQGGFDVMLSNPPWERIKLQEQEFFAARDPRIATAANKAARTRLITELIQKNPALHAEFIAAVHAADCVSKFLRQGERFPLTATGDINTYAVFAETIRNLLAPKGHAGVIVPTGVATDDTTKRFFSDLVNKGQLARLTGFENEEFIFPAIHHSTKFCTLMVNGKDLPVRETALAFFIRNFGQLRDARRQFSLAPDEFALLNPNTRTCPVFRTKPDAELTRRIYQRVPVLLREGQPAENPWGIRFMTMFHMSNDSGLFRDAPAEGLLPLYEAKMMWQFDHRFGTYEGATQANLNLGNLPQTTDEQKADPTFRVRPRYWVEAREVYLRIAVLPTGLFQAIRENNTELITLGLAHLLFGRWLLASKERLAAGLFPAWRTFVQSFPFAQGIAPTRLGLCGENPASFSPLDASYLPAEPVMEIKCSARESTAWYAADERTVSQFLNINGTFPMKIDDVPPLQSVEDVLAFIPQLLEMTAPRWLLGFRDVTSAITARTSIFSFLPRIGVGNNAPLMLLTVNAPTLQLCILGNMNSLVFDFCARQKVGGNHMNFFLLEQLPVLPPSFYQPADVAYVASRVLELVYTADDMQPLADALRAAASPIAASVPRAPYRWDEARRALLRAELDAWYARAYGLTRDELRYILDPADVHGPDFPGETFRVLKQKETAKFGEYRTQRLVLDAWDKLPPRES
jgi:hypothetical protein